MIRITIVLILFLSIVSCREYEKSNLSELEVEKLKNENDSLRNLIGELNSKYIFDSISLRDIPSYKNTYEKNSKAYGEIVIVGYNLNNQTNVIFADSISFNPLKFKNPDTLKLVNGGFQYEKKLNVDQKVIKGVIQSNPTYGQDFVKTYSSLISVKDK